MNRLTRALHWTPGRKDWQRKRLDNRVYAEVPSALDVLAASRLPLVRRGRGARKAECPDHFACYGHAGIHNGAGGKARTGSLGYSLRLPVPERCLAASRGIEKVVD